MHENQGKDMKKLSPEIRRLVMQYAAKENLAYTVALECLLLEGVKALAAEKPESFPVHKAV